MKPKVYALLVGIDAYEPPVPPLNGCLNDIDEIERLLDERVKGGDFQLEKIVLRNGDATRKKIIDGFRDHLRNAGKDDVAFFYFSGHGSQERAPVEFRYLEPDGLDETLVCFDSRRPDNYDLADKELSKLIAEVAKDDPHIIVILDSCHSGSGTRAAIDVEGAADGETRVRRAPVDLRERPLESFVLTLEEAKALSEKGGKTLNKSGWLELPQGKHIVISACRDYEEAKETRQGGQTRGVFSHCLSETLRSSPASLTYRDLFKRVNAMVRTKAAQQSPLIEATDNRELDRPFLGGAIKAHAPYFTVSYDANDSWIIDGGAMHGIPPVADHETTVLALYPIESQIEQINDLKDSVGEARVTQRMPAHSRVTLELRGAEGPDRQTTYKAIVVALPLPPLDVRITGEEKGVALIRNELGKAGPNGKPSLIVRESADSPELRIIAQERGFRIMRAADERPLVIDIPDLTETAARKAVQRLEHMARWIRVAGLSNPTGNLSPSAVKMEIFLVEDRDAPGGGDLTPLDDSEIRLHYEIKDGKWKQPAFKLRLTNTSDEQLYCVLLDLTEAYKISAALLPGGGVWLKSGEQAWANSGKSVFSSVPKDLWEQGVVEFKDMLKLIISTEEIDGTLLEQEKLDVQFKAKGAERGIAAMNPLARLMRRVQTRDIGGEPEDEERLVDWATSEALITTVRPLDSAPVPEANGEVALALQVKLIGHAKLRANARLSTMPAASHDADMPALPPILRDNPSVSQPFQFSASRNGEPGLSVLELTDVEELSAASVTPDEPLVVRVEASLGENEYVLPVAHDGEFYLPLGRARRDGDGVEIRLERLPRPVVDSRSLFGSIKICFQKIISEKLGFEFDHPLLAVAENDGKGGARYISDAAEVKAKIAAADRILLYIHGIIGDTRGMAASAWPQQLNSSSKAPAMSDLYDLILTFDYENIKTPIEETARALKKRLHDAGLGPHHGKTLHIAAHSMGGLVSRWFIEREGGNQIAERLVMLGTPNAGSPWPTVQAWATTALGLALNGISTVIWPAKVLGALLTALKSVDETLDQMDPKSNFLKSLASSPDPGIPYRILAGNTSIISAAIERQGQSRLARLLAKLNTQELLHITTALAFFGAPNDIAVSVESIKSVPAGRSPEAVVSEVACDHISYFGTDAGLSALAEALK